MKQLAIFLVLVVVGSFAIVKLAGLLAGSGTVDDGRAVPVAELRTRALGDQAAYHDRKVRVAGTYSARIQQGARTIVVLEASPDDDDQQVRCLTTAAFEGPAQDTPVIAEGVIAFGTWTNLISQRTEPGIELRDCTLTIDPRTSPR
jgi:hypothetical protein